MNTKLKPQIIQGFITALISLPALLFISPVSAENFNFNLALEKLKAPQFSLGLVGFIGKISDGEKAMRSIAREDRADDIFTNVIKDETNISVISKLYGLCGLKIIKSRRYPEFLETLKSIKETVPVRHGDIIRIENIKTMVENIDNNLCNKEINRERN